MKASPTRVALGQTYYSPAMCTRPPFALLLLLAAYVSVLVFWPARAGAQSEVRYAEEPTGGVFLPSVGISGEPDATTTTVNPAGIRFLSGSQLVLALDMANEDHATRSGTGGGLFLATNLGGTIGPKLGVGLAVEWLRPPRVRLDPDPGTPVRLTMSSSLPLGENAAVGFSWHHFFDDTGIVRALDTYDIGWSSRFGAHWAAGFMVRDVGAPTVRGVPIQRRYELEVASRPMGTDRLELGLGGRVGETRADFSDGTDLDGWLRGSVRIVRGVYFRGEVASESLQRITTTATGETEDAVRELRVSAGLELSFGGLGTTAYGTGARSADGDLEARGGTFVARLSPVHVPSVLPDRKRIERLELEGAIDERKLTALTAHLRRLSEDEDVVALFVEIDGATGGWAATRELRQELLRLRAAGKKVFAFLVSGNTRHYFLASAADRIYVDPAGGLRLTGFAGSSLYFKGLFEKLGVEAEFEKIEEYKSAPESYTRTGPTEPAFRMRNEMLDSLYGTLVDDIAKSRKISAKRIRTLIDNGPYTSGDLAKLPDLVDAVAAPDDLTALIAKEMGAYYSYAPKAPVRMEKWEYPKVAIIYIDGDIVDGKSSTIPLLGTKLVGGQTIAETVAAARADRSVEAIVLRINSPGGSALASEIMAREILKTRGKKPIICSLGDTAASGGYFAAAGCDYIFADPMTVTGSIGIFNGKFDISGLLSRAGLSWTTYRRGARADMESMFRPMSVAERALMKSKLHYYYGRFIKTVAEGRKMKPGEVDEIGRGRVWTGIQGKDVRLVDELGGLMDAVKMAKARAGLGDDTKANLVLLPKVESGLLSRLLGGSLGRAISGESAVSQPPLAGALLGLLPGGVSQVLIEAIPGSLWAQPGVPQARLPFSIVWDE